MGIAEKIERRVRQLPEPLQAEVLHFADYLLARTTHVAEGQEREDWLALSLLSAARGAEGEDEPGYSAADLSERYG